MSPLTGVGLVFGAGSGDGRAVAHCLSRSGCRRLILGDIDHAALQNVVAECRILVDANLEIVDEKCDTSDPSDIDQLIAAGVEKFGEINYCANCERPTSIRGSTLDISRSEFLQVSDCWQRSIWLAMRAEVRQFLTQKDHGKQSTCSIVNIAAAQGLASDNGFPSYCSAAHGIVGMTRTTAMDYLKKAIRINCVCPGASEPVNSEPSDDAVKTRSSLPQPPIGRYVTAEEVAEAVVFLLGEGASAITGIELPVDGGWLLYHY